MMPIKSDMSGLKTLADNARGLGETKQILLLDLLSAEFISKHTGSPDFLSFCESAGYKGHPKIFRQSQMSLGIGT